MIRTVEIDGEQIPLSLVEKWQYENKVTLIPGTIRQHYEEYYRKELMKAHRKGEEARDALMRKFCLEDLYFLCVYVLGWEHMRTDWDFARCWEVYWEPDEHLDLWAREHRKTSIITTGKTIQEILEDPELTFGFFAFNTTIAEDMLFAIMQELESNEKLKALFPDVLWADPKKEAPSWSKQKGILVKRKSNRRERTIEAWGLVDSQPTGKHYDRLIFDDLVTDKNVTTPEQVQKVIRGWELSQNLGVTPIEGVTKGGVRRYIGTRYSHDDPYSEIIRRNVVTLREYAGEYKDKDGNWMGIGPLWGRDVIGMKRTTMGPRTYACQILQRPEEASHGVFERSFVRPWSAENYRNMNLYLFADPAGERKKGSDRTAIMIIGLGADRNYYWVTGVRRQMGYAERKALIFKWNQDYPILINFIEVHGKDTEIVGMREEMQRLNFHFDIEKLSDPTPKKDRISDWISLCKEGRFFFPNHIGHRSDEGVDENLVNVIIEEEALRWPAILHEDGIDCLSHITRPRARELMMAPRISGMEDIPETCDNSMDMFDMDTEDYYD
jgi:hypothetical protein